MKKLLILFLLLGCYEPCLAIDGHALQEWCREAVEKAPGRDPMTFGDGYCMGMVEGVMALSTQRKLHAFCAPESSGKGMLLRTIQGYLDAHPRQLDTQAETLILDALGEAYPCQSSASNTESESQE